MITPFQDISWIEFSRIPNISKLPLQEQVRQYNIYMLDLHQAREQWLIQHHQGKGASIQIIGVLLQENLFDVLQEDGYQILITGIR